MTIYDNVLAYCEANSLTIKAFERKCGIANGCVRKWNTGETKSPGLYTIRRISDATGIDMDVWLKEGGIHARQKHKGADDKKRYQTA